MLLKQEGIYLNRGKKKMLMAVRAKIHGKKVLAYVKPDGTILAYDYLEDVFLQLLDGPFVEIKDN